MQFLRAALLAMPLLAALLLPALADQTFPNFVSGRTTAAAPYGAGDYIPLVRGGATYRVPGTALLSAGNNDRLTIQGVVCALGGSCTLPPIAPAAAALLGSDGGNFLAVSPGGGLSLSGGVLSAATGGGLSVISGNVQLAPLTAISHEFVSSITAGGLPQLTQPACGDLSNAGTACQASTGISGHAVPYLDQSNIYSGGQAVGPVALTYAATITPDASQSNAFTLTATGNFTLANPSSLKAGQTMNFWIDQDATGGRTMTLGSEYEAAGGTSSLALSTTAGAEDLLTCVSKSTTVLSCVLLKAFAH